MGMVVCRLVCTWGCVGVVLFFSDVVCGAPGFLADMVGGGEEC